MVKAKATPANQKELKSALKNEASVSSKKVAIDAAATPVSKAVGFFAYFLTFSAYY